MSTFLEQARARALRPVAALPRPRLTIVPKVACRAPRGSRSSLSSSRVLVGGLVGLLLLNTVAAARCVRRHRPAATSPTNLTTAAAEPRDRGRRPRRAAAGRRAGASRSAWCRTTARPSFADRPAGHRHAPRRSPRQAAGDRRWRGPGSADSTGTSSTARPAVDGRTDDTAHQRQARTAGAGEAASLTQRRGQGAQARTATTESTATPDAPPATRAPPGIQRTPATTATLTNTSHTGHSSRKPRERTSDAAQAAGAADDRRTGAKRPAGASRSTARKPRSPARGACPAQPAPASGRRAASGSRPDPSGCGAPSCRGVRAVAVRGPAGPAAGHRRERLRRDGRREGRQDDHPRGAARADLRPQRRRRSRGPSTRRSSSPTRPTHTRTRPRSRRILHDRLGVDYIETLAMLRKTDTRYVELARHLEPELAAAVVGELKKREAPRACTPTRTPCGSTRTATSPPTSSASSATRATVGPGFESALDSQLAGVNGSATFEMADGQQLPLADSTIVAARRRAPASGSRSTATSSSSPSAGWPRPSGRPGARRDTPSSWTSRPARSWRSPTTRPSTRTSASCPRRTTYGSEALQDVVRARQRREGADLRRPDRRRLRHAARRKIKVPPVAAELTARRSTTGSPTARSG